MRYVYQPSFLATIRPLSQAQASKLLKAVDKLQHAMESHQWPSGLGMTHLREDYFEFRVDSHNRVIYRRSGGLIQYVFYGDHDRVKQFLRSL